MEREYEVDKVQVRIYVDFSRESDEAIRTALSVAEELLDKNIWVEVEPIHVWIHDPLTLDNLDLPKIEINGKTMFIGRAPSREELVTAIFDRLGKPPLKTRDRELAPITEGDEGFREVVIID
ncbi:MAG: hypothetical protein ABWW65_05645 [Thermoprotei archaeon]